MLIVLLYIGLLVINAGMLSWFAKMPATQPEEAFFGFRVSREVYREQGRRILHRYRFWLMAAFIVIEADEQLFLVLRHGDFQRFSRNGAFLDPGAIRLE